MKTHLFFLVLAVAALVVAGWNVTPNQYTFASGSRVWVEGTSTIHDWSCQAGQINGNVTAEPVTDRLTAISGVTVTIPISSMDCGNGTMNGKLRDALAAAPNISFSLSSAQVGSVNNGLFAIRASGSLSIAGVTRTMNISATGRALSNGRFRITGSVPFAMSRFGVDPPTAMLGTIRTRDDVIVGFDVTVQP
ncbi:MAG: YceI family protein [Bacteroidetes bacterium]|nr:YceI family protein [Bacteroidota bacterium]